jgi:hypothetical protein
MNERTRRAIDVAGNRFYLIERQESSVEESNGSTMSVRGRAVFCPDSGPLIDEGENFFRNRFGVLFKLVD